MSVESKVPMVLYWKGKKLETLSREELIEVITFLKDESDYWRHNATVGLDIYSAASAAAAQRAALLAYGITS